MKKNKLWSILVMLVLVLGTTIAISSCSKDDDDVTNNDNVTNNDKNNSGTIVGNWYCEDNTQIGGICFNADGTGYMYFDGKEKKDNFTYEAKDGKINFGGEKYAGRSWEYSISGNKLIVSMNGMSITYTRRS